MGRTRSTTKLESPISAKHTKLDEEPVKVFILHKNLLKDIDDLTEIQLLQLRNPGTEKFSYYAVDANSEEFYQLIQFNEPNRSFFIDDLVSSNGKFYITQPLDIKFLYVYYIRKYASNKAVAIDQIEDPESNLTIEILSKYANRKELEKICDVKSYSDDLFFVKYNGKKVLAWLSLVTKRIALNIKKNRIYAGGSGARSANFEKSSFIEEELNEEKILSYAWGIIGTFLIEELHLELATYMNVKIPTPKTVKDVKGKKNDKKRKPLEEVDEDTDKKKIKIETEILSPVREPMPKEKVQTTKEKKLAKAASGTKSIMSFFKK